VIDIYLDLLMKKKLIPLDVILRVFYSMPNKNCRQALAYLERAQEARHPMRTNYFYPLLLNVFASETSVDWTDDDRLRLFRLLDRLSISIESLTYIRLIQQPFHQYYQGNYQTLLDILAKENLQSILERFCRLLLMDIRRSTLSLNVAEQVAPYFRLQSASRQDEFARFIFTLLTDLPTRYVTSKMFVSHSYRFPYQSSSNDADNEQNPKATSEHNITSIFQLLDKISTNLSKEIPMLKRELCISLLQCSSQNRRQDLANRVAEQCIKENLKLGGSVNEIDTLTNYALPRDLVEQLASYKPGVMSWREKLSNVDIHKINRTKLEEIYQDAKRDNRYPFDVQQQLLNAYIQKNSLDKAIGILHEIVDHDHQVSSDCLNCHSCLDTMSQAV
jgi:hypothetical protein